MEDERLSAINQQKQEAINQSNNMYEGLLTDNENLYNQQQDYANQYEQIQNDTLDKQLAFQQQEIEKQKQEAQQIKETEAKKAQNDYMSFINPYGVQAESQANSGLLNSGLSETSKLGGWNTYQNRLASANKAMQDAFTEYDSAINEARLNNDVQKAQNALNKLQMQLEYAQNYYSNKSTISQNQLSNNQSLDSDYYNRYQTEYQNIQNEKAAAEAIRQWEAEMAEQQRQYNENMAWQREQARIAQEQWEKEYALSQQQLAISRAANSNNSSSLTDGTFQARSEPIPQPSSFTHINSTEVVQGPYQRVSDFVGSSGNVASDGSTSIDNQNVFPTVDGRYYTWDSTTGSWVDITSMKKNNTSSNSSNNNNTNFWGNLWNAVKQTFTPI